MKSYRISCGVLVALAGLLLLGIPFAQRLADYVGEILHELRVL